MDIVFGAGATLRGWRREDDFSISLAERNYSTGVDASTQITENDITYNARTTTALVSLGDIVVENGLDLPQVVLESQTPTICAVAQNGSVDYVSAGVCVIKATGQCGERQITQYVSSSGGGTLYDAIAGYSAGSLRKYLYDQQIAALSGVTPGAAAQRAGANGNGIAAGLNTVVAMSGSYGGVNASNFIRAQGKTGFDEFPLDLLDQVLDSGHSGNGAGWRVWISPHHFLTWRGHWASDGATWRAIQGELIVEYSAAEWTGTLAKLLPSTYSQNMALLSRNWGTIGTGVSCWARLFNTYDNKSDATAERRWVQPVEMHRCNFTDSRRDYQVFASNGTLINGGDSGSPIFCGIKEPGNTQATLVMLSHAQTQYNIGSLFYADWITEINAAMAALNASGAYTVGVVDLSGFTNYA